MKRIMPKLKGKAPDGKLINSVVTKIMEAER